jgi:hypothetical protein
MPHWQNAALAKCRTGKNAALAKMPHWQKCRTGKNAALAKCPETPKAKKRPATEAAGRV